MSRNHTIYTALGVGLSVSLAVAFQERLEVHPYLTWLLAFTIMTWALTAWDKRVSELGNLLRRWRVPEFTLNLMSLLGGFAGGWIARSMFHHKTDVKRHPWILAFLIIGTLFHILFALRLAYGPPLVLWPPENWVQF